MSNFITIRPKDDLAARQASEWCDELVNHFVANGHVHVRDVDDITPANKSQITAAIAANATLICYFGHGDEQSWLTGGAATVKGSAFSAASGKAVVSIACSTARNMGPEAVIAGVESWLGFTIKVPCLSRYGARDPFGDAIVAGVGVLAFGDTMRAAQNQLHDQLDTLSADFDTGGVLHGHSMAWMGHFGAIALRDHVTVCGNSWHTPLLDLLEKHVITARI